MFHFDVPGQVAQSTHAGLPWLRFIRSGLGGQVHFWPFDGREVSEGRPAIADGLPEMRDGIERSWWTDVEPDEAVSELASLREAVYGATWGYLPPGGPPSGARLRSIAGGPIGPAMAPSVSESPPSENAFRTASWKLVDSSPGSINSSASGADRSAAISGQALP